MDNAHASADPILRTRNVTMRFGGLTAVKSLNMTVPRQSLYGLIGPNGAGKTTVFNVLTGVYCPTEGEIEFDGTRIERKKPYEITRLGAARTFQNIRLFADMTVLENVMTAHHLRSRQMLPRRGARHGQAPPGRERTRASARWSCSQIFNLDEVRRRSRRRSLPYGSQRRLEIARALATEPKLLLLDEPAAGMNPQEARRADAPDSMAARRDEADDSARRAQHEGRHGHLRDHSGDRLRRRDRHRPARRDSEEPESDRGLPWRRHNSAAAVAREGERLLRRDSRAAGRLARRPHAARS